MVTVDEAVKHLKLRVVDDGLQSAQVNTSVELEIDRLLNTAKDHLSSIGVDMSVNPLPPAIHHAVLMLVAHFFKNLEASSPEKMWFTPIGVDRLVAPYKRVSL